MVNFASVASGKDYTCKSSKQ